MIIKTNKIKLALSLLICCSTIVTTVFGQEIIVQRYLKRFDDSGKDLTITNLTSVNVNLSGDININTDINLNDNNISNLNDIIFQNEIFNENEFISLKDRIFIILALCFSKKQSCPKNVQ